MIPKVSIIILNWNRFNDIVECITSVLKSDYANYEIVVVDNASTDDSFEKIERLFPGIVLIKNKQNLGYAGGNNVGMRYAMAGNAEYVWLVNNDCTVEPQTLSRLVLECERCGELGLVSPTLYYYSAPAQIQCCGSYLDWVANKVINLNKIEDRKLMNDKNSSVWGAALLIKRAVIKKIGYFNEKFFAYHEDVDYSLRSRQSGYLNAWVTDAGAFHKSPFRSTALPIHQFYYVTRNEFWLWMTNAMGLRKIIFLKRYLSKICRKIGFYKERGSVEGVEAYLMGAYSAFCNIGGEWDKSMRVNNLFRSAMLWHPYLYADLVDMRFYKILRAAFRKVSKR